MRAKTCIDERRLTRESVRFIKIIITGVFISTFYTNKRGYAICHLGLRYIFLY